MNLSTTLLFYLLLGAAVAVAAFLVPGVATAKERWFRALTSLFFWPLYLPILLASVASRKEDSVAAGHSVSEPDDDITRTIAQVEAELDVALSSLGGWSDAVLAREKHRFAELRAAWRAQADKIHELDRLLAQPAFAEAGSPASAGESPECPERAAHCERARRANIDRLRTVRGQMHADLLNTLGWVRELVTMIHLAKYTGAPASRAEELVLQIATSVKGLSKAEGEMS
jgi:hypothetical protein